MRRMLALMAVVAGVGMWSMLCCTSRREESRNRHAEVPKRPSPVVEGIVKVNDQGLRFVHCGASRMGSVPLLDLTGILEEQLYMHLPPMLPQWGAYIRFSSSVRGDTTVVKEVHDLDVLHLSNMCVDYEVWGIRYGRDQWQMRISSHEDRILVHCPSGKLHLEADYMEPIRMEDRTIYRVHSSHGPLIITLFPGVVCEDGSGQAQVHYDGMVTVECDGKVLKGCLLLGED